MAGTQRQIRIFISSPGELSAERARAREVIERLSGDEFGGVRVRLTPLLWEDHVPASVGDPPQLAVDYYLGMASQVDIYVGIFWSTLGSPVVIDNRRYQSGTLYEFENAYLGYRRGATPKSMLLYRCVRPFRPEAPPDRVAPVQTFFDNFLGENSQYEGLPQVYNEVDAFGQRLENDLRLTIAKLIESETMPGADARSGARDRVLLIDGIQAFLDQFDDLFGKGREKEMGFPVTFRALPAADRPGEPPPESRLPGPRDSLRSLFEQWGNRLCLIGERGSGKTYAMLQLMQQLIDRARRSRSNPVPIYFNLASWVPIRPAAMEGGPVQRLLRLVRPAEAADNSTLDAWLIDELVRHYAMPRKGARQLVENRQIVFCLDGLDELGAGDRVAAGDWTAEALRAECVATINRTLADHSVQMVVCCRQEAFAELKDKPQLGFPLRLEPLSLEHCRGFLADWADLDGLLEAMQASTALQERARIPLFLRLMAVAYRGMSGQAILSVVDRSRQVWEEHLLDNYIRHCMALAAETGSSKFYSKKKIPQYLGWIAGHSDNDFLVEDLQPSLLRPIESSRDGGAGDGVGHPDPYRLYRRLSVGLLSLVLTLAVCVPCGLAIGLEWAIVVSPAEGLKNGLTVALIGGALTYLAALPAFASRSWWFFGTILGIAFALVRGIVIALSPAAGLGGTLEDGLRAAIFTLPASTAVFLLFGYQTQLKIEQHKRRYRNRPGIERYEIQPLETMDWTWFDRTNYWRGGWIGLLIGPLAGLLLWYPFGAARGVSFGLVVTLFVSAYSGLSGTGFRTSLGPNQGIVRSLRHAGLMMGLFSVGGVVIFGAGYGLSFGWVQCLVNALLGLVLSFSFLVFGGIPVIRHVCLGHVLHLNGSLPGWFARPPWDRTIAFLDDMVRYKLLRRTAGGYMFRHETIRQYYRRIGG